MSDYCINHIEDCWKEKTEASNALFNRGEFRDALLGYKEALYKAEVLNNHFSDCLRVGIPFMQVYIISCNNVAYTYEKLGLRKDAGNMLRRVIYYLLDLLKQKKNNTDMIQSELKRVYLAYVRFIEKNGDSESKHEALFNTLKKELVESCNG